MDMKILFLTNNENTYKVYDFLQKNEEFVCKWSDRITVEANYDFFISFNYRYIISKDVVNKFRNKIINLHASYLPYNRGANPNHYIDEGIDTGDILVQKDVELKDTLTLKESYDILIEELYKLFVENWNDIKEGKIIPKKQKGEFTYHTTKDFKKLNIVDWNITIKELREKYGI